MTAALGGALACAGLGPFGPARTNSQAETAIAMMRGIARQLMAQAVAANAQETFVECKMPAGLTRGGRQRRPPFTPQTLREIELFIGIKNNGFISS
ncbi:hypothetical protein [Bradyrhizobium neotropicale]|uniref:Uncharacterized protein n=1 Tax=Bradyrhizobium neotropicale TaxID=1497615 RepID=A0A176ZIQ4_9BRAD|nr:hypothetical protein [Bradyrhizobium neotropicale]OAF19656.1 hypothetical protein AXW67_36235 [Bradyrhizobium neotropicale]